LSEQSFTGLGPEDRWSSWGLYNGSGEIRGRIRTESCITNTIFTISLK